MFEDIEKLFENFSQDKLSEDSREEFLIEFLDHAKRTNQEEPDLQMRIMACAMFDKIVYGTPFVERVAEINAGISGGLSEWAKQYESRGYEVTEYSKDCQRKHCLGETFPGTYTKHEMNIFFLDSHANILGYTMDEYFKEREKYPKGKKKFLGEDD